MDYKCLQNMLVLSLIRGNGNEKNNLLIDCICNDHVTYDRRNTGIGK